MPSTIDPDKKPRAAAKPTAPTPAAKAAVAKPGATAKPAVATKPGVPLPPPKPTAARPQQDEPEQDEEPTIGTTLLKQTPAWAVSMLVHIVAILAMALIVTEPPKKEASVSIVSAPAEDDTVEEEEDLPDNPVVDITAPVSDVAMVTEVEVEKVEVVADADDVDAAPLAVELADFGDITAPANDMMSTIGAVGGTGGGYGGRKNAAALAGAGGGGGDTESAVDKALKWFIAHQMPDGGWSFDLAKCPSCQGQCSHGSNDPAAERGGATAMALLPFFGRGYTHKEGPYKKQLKAGIDFLAAMCVNGQGRCFENGGTMYSQGLAGIALSEAYAMSQDNRLQAPAQAALMFIEQAQDPVGGGWRYKPKEPGDTSALGWQLMALKSGNMSYLTVKASTIKNAIRFLDSTAADSGAFYGYTGPDRGISTTAAGLLCRMYLGWKKDDQALQRGVQALAQEGPTTDLYYDYYATQVMHHMEGDVWQAWNATMKPMLLKAQATSGHEAGSWYDGFTGGIAGGHAAKVGGRLYCTSLATMILEVYYRHLPIYRGQATDDEFRE